MAAAVRDMMFNRGFFALIGARTSPLRPTTRNLDFIGINYYTRNVVRSSGFGIGAFVGRVCPPGHHADCGAVSTMGWEVYPAGLAAVLARFSRYRLPLLVTENGVATDDEALRRDYVLKHLVSLGGAVESGVNVIGYLYWSLIDNFEWALGTRERFGLAEVDFATQERRPRPCAGDFTQVCVENRVLGSRGTPD
jgi:beta-glucosidase/6-phospho-beta-glucosidase/beta-galactosidase